MPRASRRLRGKSSALLNAPLTYDELRLRWRRTLSDDIVRALAADYLRGYEDECNSDAYKEYQSRFGSRASSPRKKPKQLKGRRKAQPAL